MNHNGHSWQGVEVARPAAAAPARARVLLAEDDDEMRSLLASALRKDGYEVRTCTNGINLLERVASSLYHGGAEDYAVVVSDIRMPGLTGLEVLADLHGHKTAPPLILITAFGDEVTHARADDLGAAAVFDKPFQIDRLLAAVHRIADPQPSGGRFKRYIEPEVTAAAILKEAERWQKSKRRRAAAQRYSGRWVPWPGWTARIVPQEPHPDPADRITVLSEEGSEARIIALDGAGPLAGGSRVAVEGRIRTVGRSSITLDLVRLRPLGAPDPVGL